MASFLLVACGVVLCGEPASGQNLAVVARAASVTGNVLLTTAGGSPFLLTQGYVLSPGDRIDTRGGGRLVIDLSDGSMVVVQPGTILALKDFASATSLRELFAITLGSVRVKINHFGGKPNPYRMNSPTASIAVRGTEFVISVSADGETRVEVYEGAVEVASLTDPDRRVLIEAGRGVLVRAGQDFRMFTPAPREGGDRTPDRDGGRPKAPPKADGAQMRADVHPPRADPIVPRDPHGARPDAAAGRIDSPARSDPPGTPRGEPRGQFPSEKNDNSTRTIAGAYDRYLGSLSEIGQVPFLLRFNAYPEVHLDSLENPAYATLFSQAEGRVFLLPSIRGVRGLQENATSLTAAGNVPVDYSVAPQFSVFVPLTDRRWVVGGGLGSSRLSSSAGSSTARTGLSLVGGGLASGATSNTTGTETSNYFTASLVAALRLGTAGRSSLGITIESLRGTGSLSSTTSRVLAPPPGTDGTAVAVVDEMGAESVIQQSRVTLGYSRDFGGHKLGLYYRYGFIDAHDVDQYHTRNSALLGLEATRTGGHSSQAGVRLRGPLTKRLFYGVDAGWIGLSLREALESTGAVNSVQRDRARRWTTGLGLGYVLGRRSLLSFDGAAGTHRTTAARADSDFGTLLQNGRECGHFLSTHAAFQTDITRHLFASASLLAIWQSHHPESHLYPDRYGRVVPVQTSFLPLTGTYLPHAKYSDFGAGWRFSKDLFVQYLYSTAFGSAPASHTLMLRFTFRLGHE